LPLPALADRREVYRPVSSATRIWATWISSR